MSKQLKPPRGARDTSGFKMAILLVWDEKDDHKGDWGVRGLIGNKIR